MHAFEQKKKTQKEENKTKDKMLLHGARTMNTNTVWT